MAAPAMELKQFKLLPSGCQGWNTQVLGAGGGRWAYCSTLAVYVYNQETFTLESVLTGHNQVITGLSWCGAPERLQRFVTCSEDRTLMVWDAEKGKAVNKLSISQSPIAVEWSAINFDSIAVATVDASGGSPVYNASLWQLMDPTSGAPPPKLQFLFKSAHRITSLRWNLKKSGLLATGHANGSITLHQVQNGRTSVLNADDRPAVVDMQWDSLSPYYMLVAYKSGDMSLFDMEARVELHGFDRQGASIQSMAWMGFAPGCFATVTSRTGVLRVWNVSQRAPIELVRVARSGFNGAVIIPDSSLILCSFTDGSVGVFDLLTRRLKFHGRPGHTETIFDVRYKPSSPNVLATSSFDSTTKIWSTPTMECLQTLSGQEGIVYTASWAPPGYDMLATGSSKGTVFVWDSERGVAVHKLDHHGSGSVFRVQWHPTNYDRIASCGSDGTVFVFQPAGDVLKRWETHAPVYGVAWSPFNDDMLAATSHTGAVNVFEVGQSAPVRRLEGHSKRSFNVVWSPLLANTLASGSDDNTVRVWNLTTGDCKTLIGHTGNVRALTWNFELPFILLSGSWDGTIRVWDTRAETCLKVITDHYADVYGLASHPERPFVYASSSRDTSLRFWTLHGEVDVLKTLAVLNSPVDVLCGSSADVSAPDAAARMCGNASMDLFRSLPSSSSAASEVERLAKVFTFLYDVDGLAELWGLVRAIVDPTAPPSGGRVAHVRFLTSTATTKAGQLEAARLRRFGGGIGVAKKEDLLQEAADMYLQLGNLRKHCDILVELEKWDAALALAPGVSVEYWRELCVQRAAVLASDDKPGVAPLLIASGHAPKLMAHYTEREQLDDALLVAQVASEGGYADIHAANTAVPAGSGGEDAPDGKYDGEEGKAGDAPASTTATQVAALQARQYMERALPVLAACCYLSVGESDNAVTALLRGGETDLAYAVASALHVDTRDEALRRLALRCERMGMLGNAIKLLRDTRDGTKAVAVMVSRAKGDADVLESLYRRAGLRTRRLYLDDAAAAIKAKRVDDAVFAYVVGGRHEDAVSLALQEFKAMFSAFDWDLPRAYALADSLAGVDGHALPPAMKYSLLAFMAFVGAQKALAMQFTRIVSAMFRTVRALDADHGLGFPVATPVMLAQEVQLLVATEQWKEAKRLLGRFGVGPTSTLSGGPGRLSGVEAQLVKLSTRVDSEVSELDPGATDTPVAGPNDVLVSASNLPSGASLTSTVTSVVTGQRVMGPVHRLDAEGTLLCTTSEAIMWALCDPFNPVANGRLINPF